MIGKYLRRGSALTLTLLLAACAGRQPATIDEAAKKPEGYRYLAWLEGDYQSDYEPKEDQALRELAAQGAVSPESDDKDAVLEHLATLFAAGKGADAEKKTKQFLSKNPNEKRAVFLLAAWYLRSNRLELANYLFSQLEKDPNFPWKSLVFNNLGMMALREKNRPLATAYFEKATQAAPSIAAPFANLGALYLQSWSFADAEKAFLRARQLDDDFEDAVLGRGIALQGLKRFEEAHALYDDYLTNHPDALSVLYNSAIVLGNHLQRREDAAQLMLRYIQRGGKETAKAHEIIQSWR